MIQIAPTMAAGAGPHKPGAAMTPVAGCVPALLDATTGAEIPAVIGEEAKGLLVLKQPWPSMARTCWGDHERFENTYFSYDGYYLTGDGARRDADGHYWITGRVDDVVVVSGHNIGTAEVESALVAHPAVSFCGVLAPSLPFLFSVLFALRGKNTRAMWLFELLACAILRTPEGAGTSAVRPRSSQFTAAAKTTQSI